MSSVLALNPTYSDTQTQFVHDFWLKLNLIEDKEAAGEAEEPEPVADDESKSGDELEEEEEEFSFSSAFGDESLISAEEAFLNGQIRPVFPLFDRDLLLSGDNHAQPEGPYCEWRAADAAAAASAVVVDASPDLCKKSNSTGFCKLRRFRELVLRSNSDGKDKFAFLNDIAGKQSTAAAKKPSAVKKEKKKAETGSSVFEKIYARRKKEESGKRLSYLPYKQVGFFASVSGLSKNVHPY
ncbi:hypothetical protein LINPERPRIM_LOCUS28252 [Linum perenne]